MAICTHTTDCGPLGEVELTISYKYSAPHNGRGIDPNESASASIYWIKVGGVNGVEVEVADDYISAEIIPACVEDWTAECMSAAEQYADAVREERREREIERRAA